MTDSTNAAPAAKPKPARKPARRSPLRSSPTQRAPLREAPVEREQPKTDWKAKYGTTRVQDFANVDEDRLTIAPDVLRNLASEGIAVQWIAEKVLGQEQQHAVSVARRNQWVPVEAGDLPGVSSVECEGLRLYARPSAIDKKAREAERAAAKAPIQNREQMLNSGIPVSGGDHPSAKRHNRIRVTRERLDVPGDE